MTEQRLIAGRYRLVSRLGSGGMGTVWHAYDEMLERPVAIKEIRFPPSMSDEEREVLTARAMSEARHAGRLSHPNIVAIHDVVNVDGQPWIVMRLVDGRTLQQVVQDEGPMTPAQAATMGLALLSALESAHEQGVVHRDVKPSNVLLPRAGGVALTDFSIATAQGGVRTRTGELLGTPGYMAPERVMGHRAGPPADLFGLGATLYFAVEGRGPFDHPEMLAGLFATANTPHPPPRQAGGLAPVLDGLLAKDPDERWTIDRAVTALKPLASSIVERLDPQTVSMRHPAPAVRVPPAESTVIVAGGVAPETEPVVAPAPAPAPAPAGTTGSKAAESERKPWSVRSRVLLGTVAILVLAAGVTAVVLNGRNRPGKVGAIATPTTGASASTPSPLPAVPGASATPSVPAGKVVIGVDLPFRGALAKQSLDTYQAMELYLKRAGNRAGPYTVELRRYDSSTAAGDRSDTATCTANARAHVAAADEIAVIGPQNSECARVQVPILNAAPGGAQLLVSHNNTSPGLTTRWDVGEPDKYYPTRVRNYARVKTTDEHQATAAAQFAKEQYQLRRCLVLHDGSPNGENLARRFATAATALDIQVSGPTRWYANRSDYTDIFQAATGDRPDCVYVGGYSSANGAQLVRDKVAVLGDNSVVRMIGSDGFSGEPLRTLPQAAGLFITTAGLVDQDLRSPGPVAEALLQAYEAQYRTRPKSASVLYGVQALQVVLAAIEKSDGTRNGVRTAVMSAPGISITAANAVLGRPLSIDPATGDVNTKMVTFLRIHGKAEVYAAAWDVD